MEVQGCRTQSQQMGLETQGAESQAVRPLLEDEAPVPRMPFSHVVTGDEVRKDVMHSQECTGQ